jgi:hypothetical protein
MIMGNKNDGGPAFPVDTQGTFHDGKCCGDYGHQTSQTNWQFPGMTLRDYFAAKVVGGFVAIDADDRCREEVCATIIRQASVISEMAYALADAMIAEREK